MNTDKFIIENRGETVFMKGRVSLPPLPVEKGWVLLLFMTSLLLTFLLLTSFNMGLLSSLSTLISFQLHQSYPSPVFVDTTPPPPFGTDIPRLAYLVSGSKGDLNRLWRTLLALYHPRNTYVLHLDLESPKEEREELVARVANHSLLAKVGNVYVIKKANMVVSYQMSHIFDEGNDCAIFFGKIGPEHE